MSNDLVIRSSIAEFLIFKMQMHEKGIHVRFEDGDLWLTQKAIAELFDVEQSTIAKHLMNIYNEKELDKSSTYSKMKLVQKEGNREVKYYNLDMAIAISYRVNSDKAIQFRRWAIHILKSFIIQGFEIDKERMENGAFFNEDYYKFLLEEINEIRLSKRNFIQRITDIYAISFDYDKDSPTTIKLFKKIIDKMHSNRTDEYLSKDELENLELIVSAFLDLAESRARRHIPMTMEDWATRIDKFLLADDRDILKDAGKISHEIACDKALSEFEKYRVVQDKIYESDFDKLIKESEEYLNYNSDLI